jgi:hypothetical protein
LRYVYNNEGRVLGLDFNSIDVLLGARIWKVYAEPKVSFVKKNFPGDVKDSATLLGARFYYRFEL